MSFSKPHYRWVLAAPVDVRTARSICRTLLFGLSLDSRFDEKRAVSRPDVGRNAAVIIGNVHL